jgi:chorismate--pyruvate lyase
VWKPVADSVGSAPVELRPWLGEPGLLTARVRATCGDEGTALRMLRLSPVELRREWQAVLDVEDQAGLLREIEFTCRDRRWIYAASVFPDSTLARHPWLARLGHSGLGESMSGVADVVREPLECAYLPPDDELVRAAFEGIGAPAALWARRAVYRIGEHPILVQELFLPDLGRCG